MIRIFAAATALMICLGCSGASEPIVDRTAPLYIDHSTGYGPFACSQDGGGTIPDWGYVDAWDGPSFTGSCQRYRGDFNVGSGHPGRAFTFQLRTPARSIRLSPYYTNAYLCEGDANGSLPVQCENGAWASASSGHDMAGFPWRSGTASSIVLGYMPNCGPDAGFNSIYMCSLSWTPFDGSGMYTAIISDGHATAMLPHGNPLKLQGVHGTDVSCIATMSNYPSVPNLGYTTLAAVYTCP